MGNVHLHCIENSPRYAKVFFEELPIEKMKLKTSQKRTDIKLVLGDIQIDKSALEALGGSHLIDASDDVLKFATKQEQLLVSSIKSSKKDLALFEQKNFDEICEAQNKINQLTEELRQIKAFEGR